MNDKNIVACKQNIDAHIITISIVTYNNAEIIKNLLDSLIQYTQKYDYKIYVIDNNSKDGTPDLIQKNYPTIKLIRNTENIGFGRAHNMILQEINSQFHTIINPDIIIHNDILSILADFLNNNPNIVMVTPEIRNEDGTIQYLPKRIPKLKYLISGTFENKGKIFAQWRDYYTMRHIAFNKFIEIDFCTGCFMFVTTNILKKVNGFDERYFMYFEDADLTRKIQTYGKVAYYPEYFVTHEWQRAGSKQFKYFMIQLNSMFKYFIKWNIKRK